MSFSKEIVEDALVACGRSCCICHKFCGVRIETHHLKPKHLGGDDSFENCIPLCFDCHAEVEHYNNNHPRGRKFSEGELRKHRDNWYSKVCELNTPLPRPENSVHVIQAVNGKGNMVAGRDLNIVTERVVKKTVVQTDPGGKHISNTTARKILELVNEYIDIYTAAEKDSQRAAKRIWSSLKKEFDVTTYKEISSDDSDRAIQWLHAQIAMARPKIRRKAPERWKQSFYKPIYARANELGMSKEDLYAIAQTRLELKKPVGSLKDLTQKNLEKLHHIMIGEVNKSKRGD
ncbi:HNH endonuclease [Desulfovibrio legallii]|uniref:HNH endonuclease n=1 Tax=Desulfovibrio legallii TaxID=571438 RepID=A0A6H3F6Z9_9BACT|nr:HNH endonuclease [Desulfovibrio legallii]TBH78851.1 HNH endonuclease [Desulfovibrio legallii]